MSNQQISQINQQQQLASNPNNSSWVFASAGSGKTRILINRLLRLLLSEVEPSKILCLTFTKAGASEMQHRIEQDLAKWVLLSDEELAKSIHFISGQNPNKQKINKARSLLFDIIEKNQKIKIQTIHSFCQSLLKLFPFEAEINPNFEILEENSKKILIHKSLKLVLKQALKEDNLKQILTQIYANKNEAEIIEAINDIIAKKDDLEIATDYFGSGKKLIKYIFDCFDCKIDDDIASIEEEFKEKNPKSSIKQLLAILSSSKLKTDNKLALSINSFYDGLESFNQYYNAFFTQKNTVRSLTKKLAQDENISMIYYNYANIIFQTNDKINSQIICNDTALILNFVDNILAKYNQLKRKSALLDYEDLIVITNRLLQNPNFSSWVQMKMDSSFDHILVDESQDTNHKQWNIIKLLSDDYFSGEGASFNKRSIFVVGDEKQSIYSFQGAQSDISNQIYNYYLRQSNELKKISLNNSFRSASSILKTVDAVFSQEQYQKAITSIDNYQDHKNVRAAQGIVEIWPQIADNKVEDDNKSGWQPPSQKNKIINSKEQLALLIAQKIKNDILGKRQLEEFNRCASYSDYMILLRVKTNGFDKELIKAFTKLDIPYSSQSRIKFSNSLIIQDFLSIAKFIVAEFDDLNLSCLLKSPIFNLTDHDLITIRHHNLEQTIFDNIKQIKDYQVTVSKLNKLKEISLHKNCFDFFYHILRNPTNTEKYKLYHGHQTAEIMDKFFNVISNFSQNYQNNLQIFLQFVNEADPEISLKSEKDDAVKILTIHSAKGLQAPIVFIPDCCYNSNKLRSLKENVSWLEYNDIKFPIWCSKKELQNNILRQYHQQKIQSAKNEYLRLLYVALTRAENELYICGFGNESDEECWYQIIKNSLDSSSYNNKVFEQIKNEFSKHNLQHQESKTPDQDNHPIRSNHLDIDKDIAVNEEANFNFGQIKGNIIHNTLEFIIKNIAFDKVWLKKNAQFFIDKQGLINQDDKDHMADVINNFLDSNFFTELINNKIRAEFEVKSKNHVKRIDLLIEKADEIIIIDYKSDEEVPDQIPLQYQKQLSQYKEIITTIYPKHKISCAILWLKNMSVHYTKVHL